MSRFAGKIALVTGSGRGIGRAIALRFAAEGADVVVNFFRNREPAQETCQAIEALGRRALLVRADVSTESGLDTLFAETQKAFGTLDILVNNAASGYNHPVMEQKAKGWDWTMNINARAALFSAQRAVALMPHGGSIVNISSIGASRVLPEYVLVGASKAALETLTRYLAVELAPMNIVVNAVSAGFVLTDAMSHFSTVNTWLEGDSFANRIPAGRMLNAEDVAGTVAFLCSPDAAMIRGQTIVIDGGYTLKI
jgi:enoyl-[acyl-carrier protein] reductase III